MAKEYIIEWVEEPLEGKETIKEGARDISKATLKNSAPDVCLTPVGNSIVPIPYAITAKLSDDQKVVDNVIYKNKKSYNSACIVKNCKGDAAGKRKGVKSGTIEDKCEPKNYSSTVNVKGKPAVRHDDIFYMNNKNTIGNLTYTEDTTDYWPGDDKLVTETPAENKAFIKKCLDFNNWQDMIVYIKTGEKEEEKQRLLYEDLIELAKEGNEYHYKVEQK